MANVIFFQHWKWIEDVLISKYIVEDLPISDGRIIDMNEKSLTIQHDHVNLF